MRVALLNGCVQTVLDTSINEATIRLLTRHGVEVVVAKGAGCCGALPHHLGKVDESLRYARANIDAWSREIELWRTRSYRRQRVGLRHERQGLWPYVPQRSDSRG